MRMICYDHHKGYTTGKETPGEWEPAGGTAGLELLLEREPERADRERADPEPKRHHPEPVSTRKAARQQRREARQAKKANVALRRKAQRSGAGSGLASSGLASSGPALASQTRALCARLAALPHDKLLQYHSVAIYREDAAHLLPGEWLCDNIIAFVYELVAQRVLACLRHGRQIQLLSPAVVQLLCCVDDFAAVLPPDLALLRLIFLPMNPDGGEHWFLCVANTLTRTVHVYDSMNDATADELVRRLGRLQWGVFTQQRMQTPPQRNFDDCGVYVLMVTAVLVHRLALAEAMDGGVLMEVGAVALDPVLGRLCIAEQLARAIGAQ